jgi:hypothetical protein
VDGLEALTGQDGDCTMSEAIASYRKTVILSLLGACALITAAYIGQRLAPPIVPQPLVFLLALLGWGCGLMLLLVAIGGLLATFRHSSRERGEQDLYITLNAARSEAALLSRAGRSRTSIFAEIRRWMSAQTPRVGELVRIRSLEEISATLDANGCLDGLPFMPEMAKHCGTTGTVFRCVDKIYDYGGRKDLRRMKYAVLIAGLRCDGSAHDGCQARCYMLWKTAWIARAEAPAAVTKRPSSSSISLGATFVKGGNGADRKYVCQFTELARASSRMSPWDPRQDLRPLLAGNVTMAAFSVAILTRLFNFAQRLRGGIGFPPSQRRSSAVSVRTDLNLQPGELVRVRDPEMIFETLDRSGKNRGLWFDRDMLKHTKQHHKVLARVERIIDDASGRMLRMKTPCIILEGIDASGEQLGFCPQHDFPYWREAWLERSDAVKEPA